MAEKLDAVIVEVTSLFRDSDADLFQGFEDLFDMQNMVVRISGEYDYIVDIGQCKVTSIHTQDFVDDSLVMRASILEPKRESQALVEAIFGDKTGVLVNAHLVIVFGCRLTRTYPPRIWSLTGEAHICRRPFDCSPHRVPIEIVGLAVAVWFGLRYQRSLVAKLIN